MKLSRTSSMGHLGGIFILIHLITYRNICGTLGHSPACQDAGHFSCGSGRCIPGLWVCDGDKDCDDGSDELHCSERACQGFTCLGGGCVARSALCDGTSDCADGSDEPQDTCGPLLRCKKDEFACLLTRCVSLRLRCDGVDDCGDGSDEASCQTCSADAFPCGRAAGCLPRAKLCDGRPDCPDGMDEAGDLCRSRPPAAAAAAATTLPACPPSRFQCGDGACLPHSWRCDNSADCSDASDEDDCDQNECLVNNGGCSHLCVDQAMGFVCDCPSGMRLVSDHLCEEVDTCLESDLCDQLCVNGSFSCDCLAGYQMSLKTGECKATGDAARLVFSSSENVRWISVPGAEHKEAASHFLGPGPLAAMAANRMLYLAGRLRGSIYRISVDGPPREPVLVLKGQGSVSGLAVDWIHHLLYWSDSEGGRVSVAPLDGSARRLLIGGLDKPTGVAVEPLLGLLFWAESGSSPKIERAHLDGQERMTLVTSSIRNPVAITLDTPRRLLYWADRGMRTISRVSLEGRYRKTVVESNGYLDEPFGLAVFEGRVYWSEEVTHSICSADKHNGSLFSVLISSIASPGGLALLHPVLQPNGPAVCGGAGTVCQHRCIPDLFSGTRTPRFTCSSPDRGQSSDDEAVVSHTVPEPVLSDRTFAGILSLIVFLSILLVGMALWWWREEFSPSRTIVLQNLSLKESQDPLIQGPARGPHICPVKETLLKLDLEQA